MTAVRTGGGAAPNWPAKGGLAGFAPGAPRQSSRLARVSGDMGLAALPMVAFLVVWELATRFGGISPAVLPPVSAVALALWHAALSGTLFQDIAATFGRLAESVFPGAVIGTVLGTLMGYSRFWERLMSASVNFLLAIPGTALFPISLIVFGLSEWAIVTILIYEVALSVMVSTWNGVKSIDTSLIRAARAYGATGVSMLWRVLVPAALPAIISGYRIAFSRAWRILIIAEMLVSVTSGLGYRLYWAREFFNSEIVYAGLFVVGVMGLLLERVVLRTLEVATVQRWGTVRELH